MASIAPLFSDEPVTKSDFARLEERSDPLEERFDRLEERSDRLEERFDRLEERSDRLEERFDRLEERFYDLQKSVSDQIHSQSIAIIWAMTGLTGIFVGAVSLLN